MKKVGVAILGMGVVGGGTAQILIERKKQIAEEYGVEVEDVACLDKDTSKGAIYGLDSSNFAADIDEICANNNVDIVVECMGGTEPAKPFLTKALAAG